MFTFLPRKQTRRPVQRRSPAPFRPALTTLESRLTPTAFFDNFEGATLDPFWSASAQSGSITFPSTAQAHSGTRSVQLNSTVSASNKYINLTHTFPQAVYGHFGVWVYDTGADIASSNYIQMHISNSAQLNKGSVLGTYDYDLGPGRGGDVYYYIKDFNVNYRTIDRTRGWHHFEIDTSPTSTVARIDGLTVFSENTGIPIDKVSLIMSGPNWRPAWVSYFDDFEYTPVPARVQGTDGPDTIVLRDRAGTPTSFEVLVNGTVRSSGPWAGLTSLTLEGLGGNDHISIQSTSYVNAGVGLVLDGGAGNDTLIGGAGNDTLNGGDKGDDLLGGAGDDVLNGQGGEDLMLGEAGNDVLSGGIDHDILWGGIGNDTLTGDQAVDNLYGEDGADSLSGGDGYDILDGGAGNDTLRGGAIADDLTGGDGDDLISGDAGQDYAVGGAGNDTINGGGDHDLLEGGAGDDLIGGDGDGDLLYGGGGNDTIHGGDGGDLLGGQEGNDSLVGGAGNDNLQGGVGNDAQDGGAGLDSYLIAGAEAEFDAFGDTGGTAGDAIINVSGGPVTLNGFSAALTGIDAFDNDGNDDGPDQPILGNTAANVLNFAGVNLFGVLYLDGGAGNDTLTGSSGNDVLRGGDDADTLYGGDGHDGLYGDAGNDELHGMAGHDALFGGGGDDRLYGEDGTDDLSGGDGNDRLEGGDHTDYLDGDAGSDTLYAGPGHDILYGGDGTGLMYGEAGNDHFTFTGGGNNQYDAIADFTPGNDRIRFVGYLDRLGNPIDHLDLTFALLGSDQSVTTPSGKVVWLRGFTRPLTSADFLFG